MSRLQKAHFLHTPSYPFLVSRAGPTARTTEGVFMAVHFFEHFGLDAGLPPLTHLWQAIYHEFTLGQDLLFDDAQALIPLQWDDVKSHVCLETLTQASYVLLGAHSLVQARTYMQTLDTWTRKGVFVLYRRYLESIRQNRRQQLH